ncbi:acyl-CoA thioesterase [Streptomyces sp. NPDC090075]|uniref:acyl-CoA thioesterase n=1 Tax=Streptomyces sp. NPDC090075 TaxID=3365937 RepID=UPI0037F9E91D
MTVKTLPPAATVPYGQLIPINVHFDELDAQGMLHNARFPLLVERAWLQMWMEHGDWQASGDTSNVVRELRIIYEAPVIQPGPYAVHLWLERIGTTGLTYGFRFCSMDGGVTYAHGTRALVRLDPQTLRPSPWSERLRSVAQELLRPSQ